MITILAEYVADHGVVLLLNETENGHGVSAGGHVLWFGGNWQMARDVYDVKCRDVDDPRFIRDEVPTC